MNDNERQARLDLDLATLESLKMDSSVFDFECHGDPHHGESQPGGFTWTFRGRGLSCAEESSKPEISELHQVEIQLPLAYPADAPEIRWLTPMFHPNVAASGRVQLREVGLSWDSRLPLEFIAERLWDLARWSYRNDERSSNARAKIWCDEQTTYSLPLDPRCLRNRTSRVNVIRYERGKELRLAVAEQEAPPEILYINEDTPVPELPGYASRRALSGDDVLYIGDE